MEMDYDAEFRKIPLSEAIPKIKADLFSIRQQLLAQPNTSNQDRLLSELNNDLLCLQILRQRMQGETVAITEFQRLVNLLEHERIGTGLIYGMVISIYRVKQMEDFLNANRNAIAKITVEILRTFITSAAEKFKQLTENIGESAPKCHNKTSAKLQCCVKVEAKMTEKAQFTRSK